MQYCHKRRATSPGPGPRVAILFTTLFAAVRPNNHNESETAEHLNILEDHVSRSLALGAASGSWWLRDPSGTGPKRQIFAKFTQKPEDGGNAPFRRASRVARLSPPWRGISTA